MADVQKHQKDLDRLVELGNELANSVTSVQRGKDPIPGFGKSYQQWFTESSRVIKQVLPERGSEFNEIYHGASQRESITSVTFGIKDYFIGMNPIGIDEDMLIALFSAKFNAQLYILESAKATLTSSLFDIQSVVQADLFDSELDAARELLRKGFFRPAGVVAGVVLERHLGQVTANHNLTIRKQSPTLGDYNELLKKEGVVDVPAWRQIQRLGDLRNLCAHNKEREPTKEEVGELIEGADKHTKTLF